MSSSPQLGPAAPFSTLPAHARRYEPFVRPVPAGTPVRTGSWRHRRWDVPVDEPGFSPMLEVLARTAEAVAAGREAA